VYKKFRKCQIREKKTIKTKKKTEQTVGERTQALTEVWGKGGWNPVWDTVRNYFKTF